MVSACACDLSRAVWSFSPYLQHVELLPNGIDLDFFSALEPPANEAGKIRLGWAGRRDTFIKGFRDYIQPLEELPGVELKFCGYVDHNLTLEEMPGFYAGIDVYVCASSYEGHNNSIMEAAAMERAIITTRVGTVSEYLRDGKSALIVDRDPEQFKTAAIRLRDDPELRLRLGTEARRQLEKGGWDWRLRAEQFRRFFREAIQAASEPGSSPPKPDFPSAYDRDHLFKTISAQNQLLREMRNGDWVLIMGQKSQISEQDLQIKDLLKLIQSLEKEILDIRSSESYQLMMRIGSNPIVKGLANGFKQFTKRN